MIIRIAKEADAAGIAKVHIDTWRSCYRGIVPDSFLDELNYEEKTKGWAAGLADKSELGFVASIDEKIVAWVTIGPNRDNRPSNIVEMYGLYVLPDYWGSNVGTALFNQALDKLKELEPSHISLWVLENNARARAFYKKNNFCFDGTRKEIQIGNKTLIEVRYECKCT